MDENQNQLQAFWSISCYWLMTTVSIQNTDHKRHVVLAVSVLRALETNFMRSWSWSWELWSWTWSWSCQCWSWLHPWITSCNKNDKTITMNCTQITASFIKFTHYISSSCQSLQRLTETVRNVSCTAAVGRPRIRRQLMTLCCTAMTWTCRRPHAPGIS